MQPLLGLLQPDLLQMRVRFQNNRYMSRYNEVRCHMPKMAQSIILVVVFEIKQQTQNNQTTWQSGKLRK